MNPQTGIIPLENSVRSDNKVYAYIKWAIIVVFALSFGAYFLGTIYESPAMVALGNKLMDAFILDGRTIAGEPWRLVTHMFVHGGPIHIFFNVLIFSMFYRALAPRFPKLGWLVIFFASGIAGAVLHLIFVPNIAAVGASGGVLGMWAALVAVAVRSMRTPKEEQAFNAKSVLLDLLKMLALNIVLWAVIPNIAHFAHGGGFLAGLILGFLLPCHVAPRVLASRREAFVIHPSVTEIGTEKTVVAVMALPSLEFDPQSDFLVAEYARRDWKNRKTSTFVPVYGDTPAGFDGTNCLEIASRWRLFGGPIEDQLHPPAPPSLPPTQGDDG